MDMDKSSYFDTYIAPDGTRYIRWDGSVTITKGEPMLPMLTFGETRPAFEPLPRPKLDTPPPYPEPGRFSNLDWGLP